MYSVIPRAWCSGKPYGQKTGQRCWGGRNCPKGAEEDFGGAVELVGVQAVVADAGPSTSARQKSIELGNGGDILPHAL